MSFEFPDEILLQTISHLQLRGLIKAIGVCKKWRTIVLDDPLTPIVAARRALLSVFIHIITLPYFCETQRKRLGDPARFNREVYLDQLLARYKKWQKENHGVEEPLAALPPIYTMYILEWPEKVMMGRSWLGIGRDEGSLLHLPRIETVTVSFTVPEDVPYLKYTATNPDAPPFPLLALLDIGMGFTYYLVLEDLEHGKETHQKVMAGRVCIMGSTNLVVSKKVPGVEGEGITWVEFMKLAW